MALPLLLPAALALATEGLRMGVGFSQNKAGKEIDASSKRPLDYIPQSEKESLMISRMMAGLRELPGAGAINENLDANAANAIRESKTVGDVDIASIAKNLMDSKEALGVETSKMININTNNLMSNLQRYGGLEKNVFDYNQKQKYAENMIAAANLRNSGLQNIFTGVSNIAAGGTGIYNTNMAKSVYDDAMDLYRNSPTIPSTEKTGSFLPPKASTQINQASLPINNNPIPQGLSPEVMSFLINAMMSGAKASDIYSATQQ